MKTEEPDNLVLYSDSFPLKDGEPFLKDEIWYLSKAFKKILVLLVNEPGEFSRLPSNVEVKFLTAIHKVSKPVWKDTFRKYFGGIISLYLFEILIHWNNRIAGQKFRENFALVRYFFVLMDEIRSTFPDYPPEKTVYYSYWGNDAATIFALMRKRKLIQRAVTRMHAFEIYYYANPYIRFRHFQFRWLSAAATVSENGFHYLRKQFPAAGTHLASFRLGVKDQGTNPLTVPAPFTIASCARMVDQKRIPKIAEAISRLGGEVRWVHFGSGPEEEETLKSIKNAPPNIKWELKGNRTHEEVLDFFKKETIHVMVNFSTLEGIPMSLIEAVSFGIPVMGTDIGGNPEVVTPLTGVLLNKDASVSDLCEALEKLKRSEITGPEFRSGVKKFWIENFNAGKNYPAWIDFLKNL